MRISDLEFRLILFCAVSVYFQRVLVVGEGSTFKLAELATLFILIITIYKLMSFKEARQEVLRALSFKPLFYLFLFMVISPIPGVLFQWFSVDRSWFLRDYPQTAIKLRYDPIFGPLIVMGGYLGCFSLVVAIATSAKVAQHRNQILKVFCIAGTMVSLYSIYACFGVYLLKFPDLVPDFLDKRNFSPAESIRATGFSSEPSSYVYTQGWLIFILALFKDLFSNRARWILLSVNCFVLILSQSSQILAVLLSSSLVVWVFGSWKNRLFLVTAASICIAVIATVLITFDLFDLVFYVLVEKTKNYISSPLVLADSGAVRSYTSSVGIEIFKRFPIFGAGASGSGIFVNEAMKVLPIVGPVPADFRGMPAAPQSGWAMVAAEQGLLGLISLIACICSLGMWFYKKCKFPNWQKLAIVGTLFFSFALFSIAYVYAIFLWFNLAILLNYAYWSAMGRNQHRELEL